MSKEGIIMSSQALKSWINETGLKYSIPRVSQYICSNQIRTFSLIWLNIAYQAVRISFFFFFAIKMHAPLIMK